MCHTCVIQGTVFLNTYVLVVTKHLIKHKRQVQVHLTLFKNKHIFNPENTY